VHNTLFNMRARGIQSGFDFLQQPAGFAISESLWEFDSSDSYAKAYLTGLSNTLRVALLGIVLATITGTLVGIGRLSRNFLIRSLCTAYVELFRNVPLLLQLFIWYFIFTEFLPPIDEALQPLPGLFFSKNGLQYPIPIWATGHLFMVVGILVGVERALSSCKVRELRWRSEIVRTWHLLPRPGTRCIAIRHKRLREWTVCITARPEGAFVTVGWYLIAKPSWLGDLRRLLRQEKAGEVLKT
jgi:His/Glu/Gln/Arg/opine family amino acid ABC transporter permease subunit